MKHSSSVPAFLTKLWTLVEDADTSELICWSQEGNSFLVLDEQRFAKEILPKFFKHNNMASFIRQLNMYGFRKVMQIDTGMVKQERDGPVEFQHPYFKHGQDDLLENIKRKVSNSRPEDSKLRQEDLTKILATVQSVHSKQESIDARLATLKRENEGLWREISDLRQKHSHQQQLIKKLIQFIVTLVQNNRILNLKRKRPILMNSNGKKPKYIHPVYDDKVCVPPDSLQGVGCSELSEDVIICNLSDGEAAAAEITEESPRAFDLSDAEIVEVEVGGCTPPPPPAEAEPGARSTEEEDGGQRSGAAEDRAPSGALQLNKASGLSLEDPMKMMDSILSENGAISQNINLLGKVELMDYLDSIDCSLEDFQAMLYGKQFSSDFDVVEVRWRPDGCRQLLRAVCQLIQYTCCPLLALLDGCTTPAELDGSGGGGFSSSSAPSMSDPSAGVEAELPAELLDGGLEARQPGRSSLVRLEPLTEAQASEETLFYLCELSPAEAEPGQLSRV
uniref:Heat shock transcription factor 2 n=1 Tax=Salarias fasciatus TaxID=181472 RepID=A0A672FG99_SALFA